MTGWAAELWKRIGLCVLHNLHQLGHVENLEVPLFSISRACMDDHGHHSTKARTASPAMFCLDVQIIGGGLES